MKEKVRFICSWLFANLLISLGFVYRAKCKTLRGDNILSIYFHKPSADEFEKCLMWLKKNKFNFLSTSDLYNIIQNRLAFPKASVILTVDDGWQTNKSNIVDVAIKFGIPVTIFISTEPVEKGAYWWSYIEEARRRNIINLTVEDLKKIPNDQRIDIINELCKDFIISREALTIKQIKEISALSLITIGGHTVSHPILNNCSSEHVYNELYLSKQKLKMWTGKDICFFAYPNGNYTEREIRILHQQGYKLAFNVYPEYITRNTLQNRYELPRFEVIENAPFSETICRMVGIWEPISLKLKAFFLGSNYVKRAPSKSYSDIKLFTTT